jgi:hypothetical protein
MASLAGLLTGIGSLFPKKQGEKDHPDFDENELAKPDEVSQAEVKDTVEQQAKEDKEAKDNKEETHEEVKDPEKEKEKKVEDKNGKGFWEENKSWIKPTAAIDGTLTLLGVGYALFHTNKPKQANKPAPPTPALSGTHSHHKRKKKKQYKKAIALL